MNPLPLSPERSIIIVSDRIEYSEEKLASSALGTDLQTTGHLPQPAVEGGYLERLPLSCIAAGIVERSEVWHHVIGGGNRFNGPSHILLIAEFLLTDLKAL